MRLHILLLAMAFLVLTLLAPTLQAAGWVDQEDGTWSCTTQASGVITVASEVKEQLELCRASDNFRFRWSDDQLDPSAWLDGLANGFPDTRHNSATVRHRGLDAPGSYKWWIPLWQEYLRRYISRKHPSPTAAGLAYVPAPPLPRP